VSICNFFQRFEIHVGIWDTSLTDVYLDMLLRQRVQSAKGIRLVASPDSFASCLRSAGHAATAGPFQFEIFK